VKRLGFVVEETIKEGKEVETSKNGLGIKLK
jgi:hypothetical protein